MITFISYQFPTRDEEEKKFFKYLSLILQQLPNSTLENDQITIVPIKPSNAYPVTIFETIDISFPQIIFGTEKEIDLQIGNVYLRNKTKNKEMRFINHIKTLNKKIKHDAVGEYIEISSNNKIFSCLSIHELFFRLNKHIVRMDHSGFNIPEILVEKKEWDLFIKKIASECNIYNYPTGELWPFVLPATKEEFKNDIQNFILGREPKFELVYDNYSHMPTIQIDIESDLGKKEVEKILPEPYGISFPDVAEFFRSVYVDSPWSNLAIRFDIRFKNDNPGGDWDTGKWLVIDGKRI